MRIALVLLSFIVVLAGAWWVKSLRRENIRLESRVNRMETRAAGDQAHQRQLARQIEAERSRLNQLQATLNEVVALGTAPPTTAIDTHVASLTGRMAQVRSQIAALAGQMRQVQEAARAERLQQSAQSVNGKMDIHGRLGAVDERLLALQAQLDELARAPRSPENELIARQIESERQALAVERASLGNQMGAVDTAAQGGQVAIAQGERLDLIEIAAERAALQGQLQDLNEELKFWQESRGRAPAQAGRVQQLQDQIRAQESRLSDLSRLNTEN